MYLDDCILKTTEKCFENTGLAQPILLKKLPCKEKKSTAKAAVTEDYLVTFTSGQAIGPMRSTCIILYLPQRTT